MNNTKMKKGLAPSFTRGFTLIELLVVIAIIGILAGIVLAALNNARDRAADAAIKGDLAGIRVQAELEYEDLGNTYNGTGTNVNLTACNGASNADTILASTNIQNAVADAVTQSKASDMTCRIGANDYAMAVELKSASAGYWCIDSSGTAAEFASDPISTADDFICD